MGVISLKDTSLKELKSKVDDPDGNMRVALGGVGFALIKALAKAMGSKKPGASKEKTGSYDLSSYSEEERVASSDIMRKIMKHSKKGIWLFHAVKDNWKFIKSVLLTIAALAAIKKFINLFEYAMKSGKSMEISMAKSGWELAVATEGDGKKKKSLTKGNSKLTRSEKMKQKGMTIVKGDNGYCLTSKSGKSMKCWPKKPTEIDIEEYFVKSRKGNLNDDFSDFDLQEFDIESDRAPEIISAAKSGPVEVNLGSIGKLLIEALASARARVKKEFADRKRSRREVGFFRKYMDAARQGADFFRSISGVWREIRSLIEVTMSIGTTINQQRAASSMITLVDHAVREGKPIRMGMTGRDFTLSLDFSDGVRSASEYDDYDLAFKILCDYVSLSLESDITLARSSGDIDALASLETLQSVVQSTSKVSELWYAIRIAKLDNPHDLLYTRLSRPLRSQGLTSQFAGYTYGTWNVAFLKEAAKVSGDMTWLDLATS